jgi:hypothetical protein
MVLRLIRALPGDRACLPPSPLRSLLPRNLMPASGHQDHTTSPSASTPFVIGASASTASRSTSVAIASAPLTEQDGMSSKTDLGESRNGIFLQNGLDSAARAARFDLPVGHNSDEFSRRLDVPPSLAGEAIERTNEPDFRHRHLTEIAGIEHSPCEIRL